MQADGNAGADYGSLSPRRAYALGRYKGAYTSSGFHIIIHPADELCFFLSFLTTLLHPRSFAFDARQRSLSFLSCRGRCRHRLDILHFWLLHLHHRRWREHGLLRPCYCKSTSSMVTATNSSPKNTENPTSLSDITTAAGWDIIECDPYSVGPQDVRLVCTDRSKHCDQLFEGGEENTIVKLPESVSVTSFTIAT